MPQHKVSLLVLCAMAELLLSLSVSDAALDLERDILLSLLYFSPLVILSCNLCTFIGLFVEDCRDFPFM